MRQLPDKFTKNGFSFVLERRNEHTAIYRQQWNGIDYASIAYEVIRPKITTRAFIDGAWRDCEPHETHPSSETWGDSGWTFADLDDATTKYNALSSDTRTHRNRFDGARELGAAK
jgi:hypothetical protein